MTVGDGATRAQPRAPAEEVGDIGVKPAWQRFLESAGGAALITALIGGAFVQWVADSIQRGAARRDFNNAWLKARGDQALLAYRDYHNDQLRALEQLYVEVGHIVSASEALVAAANWDTRLPATRTSIGRIAADFNAAEDKWVEAKPRFTFLLSYYSNANRNVARDWRALSKAIDDYRECVSARYDTPPSGAQSAAELLCGEQRNYVDTKIDALGADLEGSRSYVWRGWDSPDVLRAELHLKAN
jgi:hypothetical protein